MHKAAEPRKPRLLKWLVDGSDHLRDIAVAFTGTIATLLLPLLGLKDAYLVSIVCEALRCGDGQSLIARSVVPV